MPPARSRPTARDLVTEVRGQGLLIGVDFVSADAATEFLIGLLDEHVIPSYSLNSSNVLRLTPPAILDAADLDWVGRALTSAAKHVSRVDAPGRLTLLIPFRPSYVLKEI